MLRVVHLLLFVSNLALLTAEKTYYDLADAENHFSDFIRKYEKLYETEEDYNRRFEIFKDNLLHINDLNDIYDATYGVNAFADLTREEFEASHLGFVPSLDANTNEKVPVKKEWLEDAPDSLDYRDQGLVTEVKDQQDCGSCYVFSAIGNIEGQYAKKHKELISLSEQQGLDCDSVDNGCYGGTMLHVMQGLIKTGGSESEQDYPYHAAQINCRTDPSKIKVKVLSAKALDTATEEHLQAALLNYGPLAISLDMPDMQYYQEGVVTPMNCANPPDHAVVLVGYGKEEITSGREYWIIKNSWGTSWGEDGYFRLEKGKGYCLIGNIEGQYAKKYKKLISFSEQEGLDCDIMPGEGCDDGGQMISIMNTLVQMGGIVTEEDYPYVGIKGTTCHLNKDQIVAKVLRGQIISTQTEDLLKDALAHIGPLAVSLYLPLTSVFYKRGVYSPPDCDRTPNLAMLVVGYGTDSDSGKNYWLIKNSWGKEWGEDGYLRLERRLGICNIGKEGTASAVVA